MGDKAMRGHGCVRKGYAKGGAVKPVDPMDACLPMKRGLFESDKEFAGRYDPQNKKCIEAIDNNSDLGKRRRDAGL